jgi:hypothetical protein
MDAEKKSFLIKVVLVSAVTASLVFIVLAVVSFGVYFFWCCEPIAKVSPGGEPSRGRNEERRSTSTDGSKISSVSFQSWGHAGPLYPAPNEPPGYVFSDSVEFRTDLSATRSMKTDYDRDLPDETSSSSATMTADQFAKLVDACVKSDIINQPDSKEVISEGGTKLVIEYDGEKKSIVTSNIGLDSKEVKEVLAVIEDLKSSLKWTPDLAQ